MRLTFNGPVPSVLGRIFSAQNQAPGIPAPQIPEPAGLVLLTALTASAARRSIGRRAVAPIGR